MKKLITESDIVQLQKSGNKIIYLNKDDLLTPSAKDKIRDLKISISNNTISFELGNKTEDKINFRSNNKVAIGCDHTGFKIKNALIKFLTDRNYFIIDVGTNDENSCDYPDYAFAVAKKVKDNEAAFGICIDATGIPSAITANKIKGIRAATCYNEFSARSSVEHNNANILVVGAKALGEETIKSILDVWLNSKFLGGRHQKRLDKISAIENEKIFGK